MWNHLLQLLLQHAKRSHPASAPLVLDLSFRLFQGLCNIQSEPVDAMHEAERAVADFESSRPMFDELMARVRRGEALTSLEWLAMAFLADLLSQLRSPRWDQYYVPTFRAYSDTGTRVGSLREFLRMAPFADGIQTLAARWHPENFDAVHNAIVSVYVTACNNIGAWGDEGLYAQVMNRLSFTEPFLPTVVCAYCVKALVSRTAIDVKNMTSERYECMKLLDNFYTGPEGAWG